MASADDDNTILANNGIFSSKNSDGLRCYVCPTNAAVKHWKKHIEDPGHDATLERFYRKFERVDTTVACKECDEKFDWSQLAAHASAHGTFPWFEPDLKYKHFFQHQFFEWETQFYCYRCDEVFVDWLTAFVHIGDESHLSLAADKTQLIDSASFNAVETLYELLVSEGFVPWNAKTVKCRICDCRDIVIREVFLHMRKADHSKLKAKFVLTLKEQYETLRQQPKTAKTCWQRLAIGALPEDTETFVENQSSTNEASASGLATVRQNSRSDYPLGSDKSTGIFIIQQSSTTFYCQLCDSKLIGQSSVDDHISSEFHAKQLKVNGCDKILLRTDNTYYCEVCKYIIDTDLDTNVFIHIKEIGHIRAMLAHSPQQTINEDKGNAETPMPTNDIIVGTKSAQRSEDSRQAVPYFMTRLGDNSVRCLLCDDVAFTEEATKIHSAMEMKNERYGLYNIISNRNNSFHCQTCACLTEEIIPHIKGASHRLKHAKLINDEILIAEAESLQKTESQAASMNRDSASEAWNLPRSVQTPIGDNKDKSKAPDIAKYGGDSFISSIGRNKYYCSCCKCEIPSLANIYGHTITERHKSFLKKPAEGSAGQFQVSTRKSPCCYIVKLSGSNFCCHVCDLELSEDVLTEHAAGEQHAASLKRYGSHNISMGQGVDYYCKSCECRVPGIANVLLHIKGPRHRESLSNAAYSPQKRDSSKIYKASATMTTQKTNFQELAADFSKKSNDSQTIVGNRVAAQSQATARTTICGDSYIIANGDGSYLCTCCECVIPTYDNIYVHITGNRHINSTGQPTARHSSLCLYVVQLSDTEFHCKVCNVALYDQVTLEAHVNGEKHVRAREYHGGANISSNSNGTYYCKSCRCSIPSLANVYVHIKGYRHKSSLQETSYAPKKLELHETNANKMTMNGTQFEPFDFIVRSNATEFLCRICDLTLNGEKIAKDHLAEKTHATARYKYGCDNVTMGKYAKFYCRCCNCPITDLENVYRHVRGRNHSYNLSSSRKNGNEKSQTSETVDKEDSKEPQLNAVLSSIAVGLSSLLETLDPKKASSAEMPSGNKLKIEERKQQEMATGQTGRRASITSDAEFNRHLKSYLDTKHVGNTKAEEESVEAEEPANISRYLRNREKLKGSSESANIEESLNRGSQSTPINADFHDTGLLNGSIRKVDSHSESAASQSRSFRETNGRINGDGDRCVKSASPASSIISRKTANSGRKPRAPRMTNVQKIVDVFDFENDYVHSMKDKLEEIKLGLELCLVLIDTKKIYCLVCRRESDYALEEYIEHLRSIEHCDNLEDMEKDHALFEAAPGQFSDFDLASQYMEELSEDEVVCFVCSDINIDNIDNAVEEHIRDATHRNNCRDARTEAQKNFENIKSRAQCDWNGIQKYRCECCSANFGNEFDFAKHLKCHSHVISTRESYGDKKKTLVDFCSSCSLLWYGLRTTYALHCDTPMHKWITSEGHCASPDLPRSAELLLAAPEVYIASLISHLDDVSARERRKEETLIADVEKAVKQPFPHAKIYVFGSRASNLCLPDSNIDLFIDSGNMYDGNEKSEDRTMAFIASIHQCLSNDSQTWEMLHFGTTFQTKLPMIRAMHRATGISCNMSFGNGLGVENTKLIEMAINTFLGGRKLILFLKQWLIFCDLSGSEGISSYALCWLVILFLQDASRLSSVASLFVNKRESRKISGWEIGISRDFTSNGVDPSYTLNYMLVGFFDYYANFDYRNDVACPLLGGTVDKRKFLEPQSLPNMDAYLAYIGNPNDPEPFRIDAVMCVQDPFELQRNLTKNVNKVHLTRFRNYCAKSLYFVAQRIGDR